MVSAGTLRLQRRSGELLLATVSSHLRKKACPERKARMRRAYLLYRATIMLGRVEGYRTPRYGYLAADFMGGVSWWARLKAKKRDGAYMRFLGFPTFVVDIIVEAAAPFHAVMSPVGSTGRPRAFDLEDFIAVGLRACQLRDKVNECLQVDFALSRTRMSVYAMYADKLLHATVPTIHAARMGYPAVPWARKAWEGVVAQFGESPIDLGGETIGIMIDGVYSPGRKPSNKHQNRLYKGHKGHGFNHITAKSFDGCFVDGALGFPGSFPDTKCAEKLMARFQDPAINPGLAAVVDNGYRKYSGNGSKGGIPVFRPMCAEYYGDVSEGLATRWSAYVTTVRQPDEWANGALKKAFPSTTTPVVCSRAGQEWISKRWRLCMHLFNLRTRLVGVNQLKTTFLSHVDAGFRELVECSTGSLLDEEACFSFDEYCKRAKARLEVQDEL